MLRIFIWKMIYSDLINLKKKIKIKVKEYVYLIDFYLIILNKCIILEYDFFIGICFFYRNVEVFMVLMLL